MTIFSLNKEIPSIRIAALIIFIVGFQFSALSQGDYRNHTVRSGETIYSLSKQYNVSKEELIKLNPDAADGIKVGELMIIPLKENIVDSAFVSHKVQPKETLYGLSKHYGVSIDDLLEFNPELMHGLQIGMVIQVPVNTSTIEKAQKSGPVVEPVVGFQVITVKPKETVYSLTKRYNMTEEEFYEYNPHVKELGLQVDQNINVPLQSKPIVEIPVVEKDTVIEESIPKDEKKENAFVLYQIIAGDSIQGIAESRNITTQELLKLNPELNEGVIPGRFIILPAIVESEIAASKELNSWINIPKKGADLRISLVLPFYLTINDSLDLAYGNDTIYKKSEAAIEFYNGFKIALDTLNSLGIDVNLQVLDNKSKEELVASKIKKFNSDFVVGPFYSKDIEKLSKEIEDIAIVSPLSKFTDNDGCLNLIDSYSGDKGEADILSKIINNNFLDDHLIFVNPDTKENRDFVHFIRNKLESTNSPDIEEYWLGEDYLSNDSDYKNRLIEGKRTVWIISNEDEVFLSDFFGKLNSIKDTSMVILSTSEVFDIETVDNMYLSELEFWGLSREYIDIENPETKRFIQKFIAETNTYPSEYAMKAYDIAIYFSILSLMDKEFSIEEKWPTFEGIIQGHSYRSKNGRGHDNHHLFLLEMQDYKLLKKEY